PTEWTATRSFTVDVAPTTALDGPADGTFTTSPQVSALYSDSDNDGGSVQFRVCTAAASSGSECTGLVASGASASVSSGSTGSWAPTGLTHGTTYYWQTQAQDSLGAESAWTATQSFVYDAAPSDP